MLDGFNYERHKTHFINYFIGIDYIIHPSFFCFS